MKSLGLAVLLLLAVLQGAKAAVKDLGVACNPDSDKCAHETLELVCDATALKCLIKAGQTCTTGSKLCVTGASCPSSTCACGTGYTASDPVGTCDQATAEKAGGACGASDACTTGATCNSKKKCACDAGYEVTVTDGTCGEVANENVIGGRCTHNPNSAQGSCTSSDAVCPAEDPACQCKMGKSGADCSGDVTANALGGACTYSASNAKGTCTADNSVCPDGDSFCKCAENYISLDGTTCVPVAGQLNGACTATTANTKGECTVTDAVCTGTTAGTCKMDLGGACTDDSDCRDAAAMVCDQFAKKCLLKTDQACNTATKKDKCVTGASCDTEGSSATNNCKCIADVYTDTGNLCYAAQGKATGTCKAAAPKCDDANAECDTTANRCTCKTGYMVKNADATCEKSAAITVMTSAITVMLAAVSSRLFTLH